MSSMENQLNTRRVRNLHSLVQVGAVTGATDAMDQVLSLVEKARSFHFHKTPVTDVAEENTQKHKTVKLWTLCAEVVERRGTLRRSVSKLNVPHIHLKFHKLTPVLQGQGLVNPLYFEDDEQPIFTHMVSVLHANKHLIKFPIALDYMTLRGRNKMENSTDSTGHTNCSTVLLKEDTGADVNLMNK